MGRTTFGRPVLVLALLAGAAAAIGAEAERAEDAFKKGNSYLQKRDYDSAAKAFTEAIRLDPRDAEAYSSRGVAYQKKGDKVKAEDDFAQAKKLGSKGKSGDGGGK
jgi:Tfp pilus assembly protein PilF